MTPLLFSREWIGRLRAAPLDLLAVLLAAGAFKWLVAPRLAHTELYLVATLLAVAWVMVATGKPGFLRRLLARRRRPL
jgi:hypothetical protein